MAASSSEHDDYQLIAELSRGNRDALAQLYRRHGPQLLGLALHILQHQGDAEDLVHDVFLEAWQRADTYDVKRGTVRAWLLIKTRSRAIDRLRALRSLREQGLLPPGADDSDQFIGNDDITQPSEQSLARRALAGLPSSQRTVIELSYFQGMTYQEIATHCRIPMGTVKSRLAAAIGKLRDHYGAKPESV